MLNALGIYEHPNLLWSRRFRVTERQLEDLVSDIESNPNCIVVKDSLRSTTQSTGLQENDVQMGMLVYVIKQTVFFLKSRKRAFCACESQACVI